MFLVKQMPSNVVGQSGASHTILHPAPETAPRGVASGNFMVRTAIGVAQRRANITRADDSGGGKSKSLWGLPKGGCRRGCKAGTHSKSSLVCLAGATPMCSGVGDARGRGCLQLGLGGLPGLVFLSWPGCDL